MAPPRPVMDYRAINKFTILDHYPLPLIDQLILSLSLRHGFYQT